MAGGWGHGTWGQSPWGSGDFVLGGTTPPRVIAVDPVENATGVAQRKPICIRTEDDGIDGSNVLVSTFRVSVSGVIYILGGVAQNGAEVDIVANDENGFDVELRLPDPMPVGSRQEVVVFAEDTAGNQTTKNYFFTVGVGTRLLKVTNPQEGVLLAVFNRPMRLSSDFLTPSNWVVNTITAGASDITITEAVGAENKPETVILRHVGGGSTYELCVLSGESVDGDPIEDGFNKAQFELVFAQEEPITTRLFDTIFGPIGVQQRTRRRRTIDQHVTNRSIALAMDEQFRLRLQRLDGTAGRDGRPGKRRT